MHVIPANAENQMQTGCRIESGMTELGHLIRRVNNFGVLGSPANPEINEKDQP
jgi:hypothetical protein